MTRFAQELSTGLTDSGLVHLEQDRNATIVFAPFLDKFVCGRRGLVKHPAQQLPCFGLSKLIEQAVRVSVGGATLVSKCGQLSCGPFEALR